MMSTTCTNRRLRCWFRLIVLAFFSHHRRICRHSGGIDGGHEPIAEFLQLGTLRSRSAEHGSVALEWMLMAASITAAAIRGLSWRTCFTSLRPELPGRVSRPAQRMYSILTNKYYVDEIYDAILVMPIVVTSREFLWKFIDVLIIDGMVNGIGQAVRSLAGGLGTCKPDMSGPTRAGFYSAAFSSWPGF